LLLLALAGKSGTYTGKLPKLESISPGRDGHILVAATAQTRNLNSYEAAYGGQARE
jgi:hypothetical protein